MRNGYQWQLQEGKLYFLYWASYLLIFSFIEGVPANDFVRAFACELVSLIPKIIFVTLVVQWLASELFFTKKIVRFCMYYVLLLVVFAFVLRLVDNYIILRYFLTDWRKEPLLSSPPFLYNAIKLQFLSTIPFSFKLFNYWIAEKRRLDQVQKEAEHFHALLEQSNNGGVASTANHYAFLTVKCDRRMVKISFSDIYFFETRGNSIHIHTTAGEFKTYLSVSKLEEKLPDSCFFRIHRSFIVSISKIETYTKTYVVVCNQKIPIGRSYSVIAKSELEHRITQGIVSEAAT